MLHGGAAGNQTRRGGRVLRAWGWRALSPDFVDAEDQVWLLGAGAHDGHVLKFTIDGKPLLRIGPAVHRIHSCN